MYSILKKSNYCTTFSFSYFLFSVRILISIQLSLIAFTEVPRQLVIFYCSFNSLVVLYIRIHFVFFRFSEIPYSSLLSNSSLNQASRSSIVSPRYYCLQKSTESKRIGWKRYSEIQRSDHHRQECKRSGKNVKSYDRQTKNDVF